MAFTLSIEPEWNIIKNIKKSITDEKELQNQNTDFLEATIMTAIELVENALKYSDFETSNPVQFHFDVMDNKSRIRVENGCRKTENLQTLKGVLTRIQTENPFELYVERLEKLKDDPDGHSRMGLLRIAYEAEYKLEACIENGIVAITATRLLETGK